MQARLYAMVMSFCLFVCSSVCRLNAYTETRFLSKTKQFRAIVCNGISKEPILRPLGWPWAVTSRSYFMVPTTLQNSFSLTFPDKVNYFPWLIYLRVIQIKNSRRISLQQKFVTLVWGSAVSSSSGVWGGAPAEIEFGTF